MRVYQQEEVPGSPEAHAVFLEAGQPLQEQALARSPQESRPLELAGAARAGLEGPEQRRRFSASELVTRLHSSLRLGRNLAGRAQLGLVAGTGAAREGSTPELDHPAGVGGGPPRLAAGQLGCGAPPSAQGHSQALSSLGKMPGRESHGIDPKADPSENPGGWSEPR